MSKLNENYYLRKYYLKNEQVPTQSVMKNKMSPMLANVYFKSMTSKLKVLAGLEPPMKGGGSDWYVPPADVLEGRIVMKPLHRKYLSKLSFSGIDFFGERILREHHEQMEEEKQKTLLENDRNWKQVIERSRCQYWDDMSKEQSKENTTKIQQAFHEFTALYATSITKIEAILSDAATKEIERVKEAAFNKMASQYEALLQQQATMLYDRYTNKLFKEKTTQKEQFISVIENSRTEMGNKLHDINVEKHVAIEKLRIILECQNLACQVYVALKEREECKKEIELSKHEHKKKLKDFAAKMQMQNFEIKLAKEKEMRKKEFIQIWQRKICHVVKRFQEFVKYCLNTLPEQAEFFINMEKLMLLQLSESLENPSVESIFITEEETFHTPIPKPHPFYLFCDKGYKQKVEDDLCPKHCTSSASQLPVIVVNKKCIYSACDNFYNFAEKVQQLLQSRHDEDLIDDHDYKFDIPIKCTSSEQLGALKLESSLMQLLQKEFPNPRDVKIECCVCKIPTCYCDSPAKKASRRAMEELKEIETWRRKDFGPTIIPRSIELEHEREPKWESYIQYTRPKRCQCARRIKKDLKEHLPAYMLNVSTYNAPDLPNYETCTLDSLKKLVKKSRGRTSPKVEAVTTESKTRNVSTQYSDQEFELLCTCFSDEEADKLLYNLTKNSELLQKNEFKILDGSVSSMQLNSSINSFVHDRAHSLRRLLDNAPELEEIFIKENCNFND
ncbi:uncharacterized protein LOC126774789 [Nymphalis io]|uniref:uncharacterized protein LOC126774789 n=1 Tax=Inachis io TaxID=171585 RepID=UPI00216A0034|nr:uncharacterized protein LOC126774789 [Nymphalis io]